MAHGFLPGTMAMSCLRHLFLLVEDRLLPSPRLIDLDLVAISSTKLCVHTYNILNPAMTFPPLAIEAHCLSGLRALPRRQDGTSNATVLHVSKIFDFATYVSSPGPDK